MDRTAGIVSLLIDGEVIDVVGNVLYRTSDPKTATLVGSDGHVAHQDVHEPGRIELEIRNRSDLDVGQIRGARGVTIQANLRNGKQVIGTNMAQVGDAAPNTEEGNIAVEFEGVVEESIVG